jgi:KipI family sensor histidine kinase inhibitor
VDGEPLVEALGDAALLVTFGERIDRGLNRRARAFAGELERRRDTDPRFGRPVTSFASVLVPFDPVALDDGAARAIVGELLRHAAAGTTLAGSPETPPASPIEISVSYGGAEGPDLDELASLHGLTAAGVVELHAATTYEVFFLGFAPGFAYLGTVPAAIATPRLARPRERVPAGSVGIAAEQTGIYPFAMPGGWRLIGRTERVVWDTGRERPALLLPGDRVRFVPIR